MRNRLRLMMGVTALLYAGPLLAGLGGFGWGSVPVFIAIFLLWLVIIRPEDWPQTLADWRRPEVWVALAARVAVQALLVVACFGIGRGIGGVAGALPPFPLVLPLAVSFVSIPLARLVWDPKKAAAMDAFLDEALVRIEDPGAPVTFATVDGADDALAALDPSLPGADGTGSVEPTSRISR